MIRKYALSYVFPGTDDGSPNREMIDSCLDELEKRLAFLDACASGDFIVGNQLTYADLALYPTLHYMTQFPESSEMIQSLGNLKRYIGGIAGRASAVKTQF